MHCHSQSSFPGLVAEPHLSSTLSSAQSLFRLLCSSWWPLFFTFFCDSRPSYLLTNTFCLPDHKFSSITETRWLKKGHKQRHSSRQSLRFQVARPGTSKTSSICVSFPRETRSCDGGKPASCCRIGGEAGWKNMNEDVFCADCTRCVTRAKKSHA